MLKYRLELRYQHTGATLQNQNRAPQHTLLEINTKTVSKDTVGHSLPFIQQSKRFSGLAVP